MKTSQPREKRDTFLGVHVTAGLKKKLEVAATRDGRSLSAHVYRILKKATSR